MIKDNIIRIYVAFFLNLVLCLFSAFEAYQSVSASTFRSVMLSLTSILFGVFTWFAYKRYLAYKAGQNQA